MSESQIKAPRKSRKNLSKRVRKKVAEMEDRDLAYWCLKKKIKADLS